MPDISFTLPNTEEVVKLAMAKVQADIDKARLDTEKSRVELEKLHKDVEAQSTLLRQLQSDSDCAEIHAKERKFAHELDNAKDFFHRVYRFTDVTETNVGRCIDTLSVWDRIYPGTDVEIVFNSPGGDVIAGMDLFDFIQEFRRRRHYVITSARGWAASMGGILLQAGDWRVMGREAYVLIHEVQTLAGGKTSAIEDEVNFLKKMQARVLNLFAERSAQALERGTAEIALTREQLEHGDLDMGIPGWSRREWWLDSEECLKYGIVDEVR